jgi:glutathione S-transferase
MKIVGSYTSPYVRKVLACLALKGLAYEIDPIVPFHGDDRFSQMSPLRRIPVLIDGDLTLCDSSVICAYLDEAYPDRPLLPSSPKDRARARWYEEFADTRMGEVFIWGLFQNLAIKKYVFGEEGDPEIVERMRTLEAPSVLDYLEAQVPAEGFLFGDIGLADISIAVFFRTAEFVRYQIDATRWPKAAAFVARVLDHPSLKDLRVLEDAALRTPPPQQRDVLKAAGAPISAESLGGAPPRKGVMAV